MQGCDVESSSDSEERQKKWSEAVTQGGNFYFEAYVGLDLASFDLQPIYDIVMEYFGTNFVIVDYSRTISPDSDTQASHLGHVGPGNVISNPMFPNEALSWTIQGKLHYQVPFVVKAPHTDGWNVNSFANQNPEHVNWAADTYIKGETFQTPKKQKQNVYKDGKTKSYSSRKVTIQRTETEVLFIVKQNKVVGRAAVQSDVKIAAAMAFGKSQSVVLETEPFIPVEKLIYALE